MPSTTETYTIDPRRLKIYEELLGRARPEQARALMELIARPRISAGQRRIRSLAAGYPGGVGLGQETRFLAETAAEIGASAGEQSLQALAQAGQLTPQFSKVKRTQNRGLAGTIGDIAGIVSLVTGIPGMVAGGIGGMSDILDLLDESRPLGRMKKYLNLLGLEDEEEEKPYYGWRPTFR